MKSWWLCALTVAGMFGSSACALETSKSGQACLRSTQCAAGLACVSGKCSKDLSSIAAHNTVPMLGMAGTSGARAAAGGGGAGISAGAGGGAAEGGGGAGGATEGGSGAGEGGGGGSATAAEGGGGEAGQ
jgi:hypothetical protein